MGGLVGLTGPRLDPGLVGLSLSCLAVASLGLAVPSRRFPSLLSGFSLLPVASRGFPLLPVASRAHFRCESVLIYASGHRSGWSHWSASGPQSGWSQLVVPCGRFPWARRAFSSPPVASKCSLVASRCFPLLPVASRA